MTRAGRTMPLSTSVPSSLGSPVLRLSWLRSRVGLPSLPRPRRGRARMSDDTGAIVMTRLFTEALDARDLDALRVLVADNVGFRNREGGTVTGWDGMKTVVDAARDVDNRDELHRTAVFEVCAEAVSAFDYLEHVLQADGRRALERADLAHCQQHARHERLAVKRVVADRERLARTAEDDLL